PFTENEIKSNCTNIVHSFTSREVHIKSGSSEKKYNFSHIFGEEVPQRKIYNVVVSPLIENIISGYNCTVFAYGQTGTGKTHTIVGGNNISLEADVHNDPSAGMIPRAVAHLFSEMNKLHPKTKCTVKISFVEIYNEEVRDLLSECAPLRVYDNPESKGSVYIRGLREVTVCNPKEVYEILNVGTMNRQTTLTNLNAQSSRAHTLFTLLVETREIAAGGEELITTGKLHLVDLAGSENIERTGATDVRAREAGVINKSLLTLGKVIKALAQKSQHIPYRDSKLTRILQDSLGGNTKTCMIATISPDANYWDETVNTLDYANLALSIANYPQVNITRKRINYLEKLQDEMSKLRQELLAARTGEGVYVSVENYNIMLEDTEKSHRLILELIGQIRQLEECKRKNQQQYEELNEFFQQTKIYLETISRELELKKDKIKQNEAILNCKREREKKLSEKANLLLKVCEAVSRQEEIYYSKYESQCSVTLSNANLSKSILSSSVNYLEEAQNISNVYSNDQETFTSEVKRSVQLLKGDDDFGKIAQLSSEMQADNYDDFSLEKVFKSDIADYGESNTKKYFNRIHDNILAQLES
ncbi:Kinesin and/or SCP-1 domain containing protein, partial [Asbolus verrucosus]